MATVHYLRTWTPLFKELKCGLRQIDIRKNDRNFKVGDTLILDEFNPETQKHIGNWTPKLITHVIDDERYVKNGYVVLGMKDIKF